MVLKFVVNDGNDVVVLGAYMNAVVHKDDLKRYVKMFPIHWIVV